MSQPPRPEQPTAFLPGPGLNAFRPAPTPPPGVCLPLPPRLLPPPPLRALPTLTVRPNGDVTLTKALLAAIPHLHGAEEGREGSPVVIVVPARRGRGWYLDTRPRPGAGCRLPDARQVARFRIPAPSRTHFLLPMPPAPGKGRARGTAGFCAALTFALGPELPAHPGYYELLPVR